MQGCLFQEEARANVSAIDCPTLFIHAADDETVHKRETVNQESIRFLKKFVNQSLDEPAFDVATIQSAELRCAALRFAPTLIALNQLSDRHCAGHGRFLNCRVSGGEMSWLECE